jgi:hypothetical protein
LQEKGFEILVPLLDRLLWDEVRLISLGEEVIPPTTLALWHVCSTDNDPSKILHTKKNYDGPKTAHHQNFESRDRHSL